MIEKLKQQSKPMKIMLLSMLVLFGGIILIKLAYIAIGIYHFKTQGGPVSTVSVGKAELLPWQPTQRSVGSLRTTLGVEVTAQLTGMIKAIYFKPGSEVKQGAILVQQNADTNIAQLHVLEANAELAKITYIRDKAQYKVQAVSKQQLDTDFQNLKSANAQVQEQEATVQKLTIRAPFSGRLGISKVNPGQFLNPGDSIVTLQSLDPIYVDFYLPQQYLSQLKTGQDVKFTSDTFPGRVFIGKITTVNPIVEVDTRNVEVEATISNPKWDLKPGMFVNVEVKTGKPISYVTIPQTAVSFNPYGDIVYVVQDKRKAGDAKPINIVTQLFVTTGDTRGEQISILKGLSAGSRIVTSGQLKLRNGDQIAINNTVQPSNNPNPTVTNDHEG